MESETERSKACPRFPAQAVALRPRTRLRTGLAAPRWPVSGLAETTPVAFPAAWRNQWRQTQARQCLRTTSAYRCGGSAGWDSTRRVTTFLLPV